MKSLLHFWCGDTNVYLHILLYDLTREKRLDKLYCGGVMAAVVVVVDGWNEKKIEKRGKEKVDRSLFTSKAEWLNQTRSVIHTFFKREREKLKKKQHFVFEWPVAFSFSLFLQLPCRFLSVVQVLLIHCPVYYFHHQEKWTQCLNVYYKVYNHGIFRGSSNHLDSRRDQKVVSLSFEKRKKDTFYF